MSRWVCAYMIHLKVGGRVQGYKGLTFVTIRGAGHEVPLLQHSRFLQMLRVFLADKSLPATPYVQQCELCFFFSPPISISIFPTIQNFFFLPIVILLMQKKEHKIYVERQLYINKETGKQQTLLFQQTPNSCISFDLHLFP